MSEVISAPQEWVEAIGELQFPESTDQLLQELMDRNNEGKLTSNEKSELTSLVDLSEKLALIRAEAFQLLGRKP